MSIDFGAPCRATIQAIKTVDPVAVEPDETVDRPQDHAVGVKPDDGMIRAYGTAKIEVRTAGCMVCRSLIDAEIVWRHNPSCTDRVRSAPQRISTCI